MDNLLTLRHSTSHLMASAIVKLFPETKLAIGPATEDGFYYDIDLDKKLKEEDLILIENEMKNILKSNLIFENFEKTREEAINHFQKKMKFIRLKS